MDPEKRFINVTNDFQDRKKQLEEQLKNIEKSMNKHNNHTGSHVPKLEELSIIPRNKNKIKGFRGRQSIFKRPEGPAPKTNIRTIADYRKNPAKWTYYNLENVSDISDDSNKQVAFDFLNELKQRKQAEQNKIRNKLKNDQAIMDVAADGTSEDNMMDLDELCNINCTSKGTMIFKKPQKNKEQSKEKAKPSFVGNKVVMPEYEIGSKKIQKKKNVQRNTSEKVVQSIKMKLDHLEMDDDEEE